MNQIEAPYAQKTTATLEKASVVVMVRPERVREGLCHGRNQILPRGNSVGALVIWCFKLIACLKVPPLSVFSSRENTPVYMRSSYFCVLFY